MINESALLDYSPCFKATEQQMKIVFSRSQLTIHVRLHVFINVDIAQTWQDDCIQIILNIHPISVSPVSMSLSHCTEQSNQTVSIYPVTLL